ncbi:MAG: ATP-binding protein [Myxococcales bacterium]
MTKSDRKIKPSEEIAELRARLEEAEETLDAIRLGHVEALLVDAPTGPRVFTLEGADHRYRRLVETMSEGALLLSPDGLIVYSNAAFANMMASPLETVIGRSLADFVDEGSLPSFRALLAVTPQEAAGEPITLRSGDGRSVSTVVSISPNEDGDRGLSVIVTNLTVQKRNEEIVASERLANSILDQAAEAIVVTDPAGIVIRANRTAQEVSTGQALRQHVLAAFPLVKAAQATTHPALRALRGEIAMSVELPLDVGTGQPIFVLCTAAPLLGDHQEILGCVMSMTDITAHKRAESDRQELLEAERAARSSAERARAEAESSNRTKDEFLATISHELRTPLSSIVGWSRLMSTGTLPPERQRHGLDVIRRNADAQARLVEDLLDVSRITSGKLRLDVKPVPLATVIAAVLDSVRPALDAKKIRLETHIDSEDIAALGDESRIQQVIWNLLSNATKFTPANGRIFVGLRRVASEVEIVVTDSGEGIEAEFLPYVFDRFRQADGGISRLRGGLGLGLAISRHLVELHGGTIVVASDGPGCGSTFTVRLPQAAAKPQVSLLAAPGPRASQGAGPPVELNDLSLVHVLLVEDDADSRDLFVSILHRCGARVTDTDNGQDALKVLEAERPDVLVSDVGMAKMDGYSLIRNVRALADAAAQHIPAIALTAFARVEDRRRALAEGFQMHLAKPIDPAELTRAIAELAKPRAIGRA